MASLSGKVGSVFASFKVRRKKKLQRRVNPVSPGETTMLLCGDEEARVVTLPGENTIEKRTSVPTSTARYNPTPAPALISPTNSDNSYSDSYLLERDSLHSDDDDDAIDHRATTPIVLLGEPQRSQELVSRWVGRGVKPIPGDSEIKEEEETVDDDAGTIQNLMDQQDKSTKMQDSREQQEEAVVANSLCSLRELEDGLASKQQQQSVIFYEGQVGDKDSKDSRTKPSQEESNISSQPLNTHHGKDVDAYSDYSQQDDGDDFNSDFYDGVYYQRVVDFLFSPLILEDEEHDSDDSGGTSIVLLSQHDDEGNESSLSDQTTFDSSVFEDRSRCVFEAGTFDAAIAPRQSLSLETLVAEPLVALREEDEEEETQVNTHNTDTSSPLPSEDSTTVPCRETNIHFGFLCELNVCAIIVQRAFRRHQARLYQAAVRLQRFWRLFSKKEGQNVSNFKFLNVPCQVKLDDSLEHGSYHEPNFPHMVNAEMVDLPQPLGGGTIQRSCVCKSCCNQNMAARTLQNAVKSFWARRLVQREMAGALNGSRSSKTSSPEFLGPAMMEQPETGNGPLGQLTLLESVPLDGTVLLTKKNAVKRRSEFFRSYSFLLVLFGMIPVVTLVTIFQLDWVRMESIRGDKNVGLNGDVDFASACPARSICNNSPVSKLGENVGERLNLSRRRSPSMGSGGELPFSSSSLLLAEWEWLAKEIRHSSNVDQH